MIEDNLKIEVKCNDKATKAIKKLRFDMFLLSIGWRKKETPNNKLRRQGKPMIRKQALIKAYKNLLRKENELIRNLSNAEDFIKFKKCYEELTRK